LYAEFKRRLWYTTGSLKKIIYLDSYIYLLPLTVLYICFFSECGLDSLDSVITILSIATLPYLIFEVFNLSRINEPTKKALFFIKKSKELLTWGTANIVISFAATRSIPFLLSWIVGVKDAAIYNAFFSIISVINPLFLAVTNYFTSKISSLDSQSKRRIAYYKLIKFLGPVLAVVILVIFNFHKEIMLFVFNAEYAENSYYLLWMSFSLILILAANLIQLDLRAKEKLNVIFYGFLVALVFVFTVGLMLINMYSLMGGVITFILLWFFVNGYWYLFDHG
jgi:O-antigen/teichoic acid export membrane protein